MTPSGQQRRPRTVLRSMCSTWLAAVVLGAGVIAITPTPASADTTISMPKPAKSKRRANDSAAVTTTAAGGVVTNANIMTGQASQAAAASSSAVTVDRAPGREALTRYARNRTAPRNTYYPGRRRGYSYNSGYYGYPGYGFCWGRSSLWHGWWFHPWLSIAAQHNHHVHNDR